MKKLFTSAVILAMVLSSRVYAASIDSVVVTDLDNSVLSVSGTVGDNDSAGVSVVVLKKGQVFAPGMLYNSSASIQLAQVSDDKKFEASFRFTADAGEYTVYVSNGEKSYDFEFISKDDVLGFVEKLGNNEFAESEIFLNIDRYAESLGTSVSFANSDDKQQYLAKSIDPSLIKEEGIDGLKSIIERVKGELEFFDSLNDSGAAPNVNLLLKDYADLLGIDLTEYNKLSDSSKTKVCLNFVGASYSDVDKFKNDFEAYVKKAQSQTSSQSASGSGSGSSGGGTSGTSSNAGSNNKSGSAGGYTPPVVIADSVGMAVRSLDSTPEEPGRKLLETFSDLQDTRWAWDYILFVVENDIMNGFDNGTFKPDEFVTREQFAKIVTLAFGVYDETLVPEYTDVSPDNWAAPYIASANASGIMTGTAEGVFGYGAPITRQDLCVAIFRAAQKFGIEFENKNTDFTDFENIYDYAKDPVAFMAGHSIISGMGDGTFRPLQNATRAQAAKIISAVLGMEGK